MILGTGIDIIEVDRIREAWKRHGLPFAQRILTPPEIEYCLAYPDPAPHLAARFAAKEAVSKAFGTGIGNGVGWHDIQIDRAESGKPSVTLSPAGLLLMQSLGARSIHVSLTHSTVHAAAVAILEN